MGYSAEELLEDNGYEDVVIFTNPRYDDALVGMSVDNRAIYDYEKMVECLVKYEDFTEDDAMEFIDYNIVGFYTNGDKPIVMFPLERFDE